MTWSYIPNIDRGPYIYIILYILYSNSTIQKDRKVKSYQTIVFFLYLFYLFDESFGGMGRMGHQQTLRGKHRDGSFIATTKHKKNGWCWWNIPHKVELQLGKISSKISPVWYPTWHDKSKSPSLVKSHRQILPITAWKSKLFGLSLEEKITYRLW